MINPESAAFPREGEAEAGSGGLPGPAEYTTLSPEHEDCRRTRIAHR